MAEESTPKRLAKVMKLRILKPGDTSSWSELADLLRAVRYRTFRLANLYVSEAYLNFHLFRTGRLSEYKVDTIGKLNGRLRELLAEEKDKRPEAKAIAQERLSKTGALPATIVDALKAYKLEGLTSAAKWSDVVRGKSSLPTFKNDMAVPVRCDTNAVGEQCRLHRAENGDVVVELPICLKPYPRVVLQTGTIGGGAEAVLERLLANPSQSLDGYRQRCFEIKQDRDDKKWWLFITYDMPAPQLPPLSDQIVVGVDLGFSCPLYAAINNGHARLGRQQFAALGARIRSLQAQTIGRRRSMLRGGRSSLSAETARSGHGRKRKLQSIQKLEGRIDDAYTTLNHQLSRSVVDFAVNHGAAIIQMEDLEGLRDVVAGTFLGSRWRYHQLQQYIEYKAKERGILVRKVNPRFTSRRCSACGKIHETFDRAHRDANARPGFSARFVCPACQFTADADYNAARNLSTIDIAALIERQCATQGLALSQSETRPRTTDGASGNAIAPRVADGPPAGP